MLSLVRSGPTIIKIKANSDPLRLIESIERISFSRETNEIESYNNAGEGDTLVFFYRENEEDLSTYQTTMPPTTVLSNIIQQNLCSEVDDIQITPPNIMMRLLGNIDAGIDKIAVDFNAREAERNELVHFMDEKAVLVNFTMAPLNRLVPLNEFYKRALLIDKPYGHLLVYLRAKAQEYLSIAMGGPDLKELEITLFDAMDQFNLHYQRLIATLQGLDFGIVTGEDWIPEYTIGLRKSEVYSVRLLSPFSGRELKQICIGLEYNQQGERVVDFDVYEGKKKIGWAAERKNFSGLTRKEIGSVYREKLMNRLPAEAKTFLIILEAQVYKSENS